MHVLHPVVEDHHLLGVGEEIQLDPEVAPVVARLLTQLARPDLILSKLVGPTFFQPKIFQALWHLAGKVLLPAPIPDTCNIQWCFFSLVPPYKYGQLGLGEFSKLNLCLCRFCDCPR